MANLSSLSGDLASIVESAGRSLVQVDARRGISGSGVIWTAKDLVVTANHVLMRDEDIHVGLGDGTVVEATLVGRDPATDLALLRLEKQVDATLEWAAADSLKVGQLVLALGRPGKTVRASLGIISVFGESWRTRAGGTIDNYIETDATAFPGFSGGPMVSAEGQAIGIVTTALTRDATIVVPASTVKTVTDELLQRGRISRGYLGVGIQPARLPSELAGQTGQETGLLVTSVDPGSPGDKAGLVMGDTLLAIGDNKIRHWDDLHSALGKDKVGVNVMVRILRAGKVQEVKAIIGEHP